jgi:hypothetical protein
MKHKAKQARLERKQSSFLADRTVQEANSKHPGSFHKPGSLKKS